MELPETCLPAPEPAPFAQWDAERVIAYLDACGARIDIDTGAPQVRFKDGTRKSVKTEILPHLAGVRGQLIDHYFGFAERARKRIQRERRSAERSTLPKGETPKKYRKRLIAEAIARANETRRPVRFLKLTGLAVGIHAPAERRKAAPPRDEVVIPIEREATHVCVEGDAEWTPLPRVMTRVEMLALTPKSKRKGRKVS